MKSWILFFGFILLSDLSFSQGSFEPRKSFENFWHAYDDNYAFFNLDSLGWNHEYDLYKDKVNSKTTEKELMNIFKVMLNPLDDGHSYIFKGDSNIYHTKYRCSFDNEFSNKTLIDSFWNVCFRTLENNHFLTVKGYGPKVRNNSLYYATTSDNIGYIKISRFYGKIDALFDEKAEAIDSVRSIILFDSLLVNMINKKALIIDLRNNNGGNGWSFDLARRFINHERVAYYKSTRQKGSHDNFSDLIEYRIKPDEKINYQNSIIILTNCKTASSAEHFLIYVKDLPNVKVIGSRTKGIFSNSMNYMINKSENIWGTLSNERIYDSKKICYERIGVPVDIEVNNDLDDLENNVDPVILKAIEVIN